MGGSYGLLHDTFSRPHSTIFSRIRLAADFLFFNRTLAQGIPILQHRSCTNSHYRLAAKFLRCQNAGEKKTAASWLHQLAREDQTCSEKGMLFIARCAAREREASRAGCTASALQGVLPGGRESRGAGSPSKISSSFRDIFLGRATLSGHVTRISMRKDDVFRV